MELGVEVAVAMLFPMFYLRFCRLRGFPNGRGFHRFMPVELIRQHGPDGIEGCHWYNPPPGRSGQLDLNFPGQRVEGTEHAGLLYEPDWSLLPLWGLEGFDYVGFWLVTA